MRDFIEEVMFPCFIIGLIVIVFCSFIVAPVFLIKNYTIVKQIPAKRDALEATYVAAKEEYQFQPLSQLLNSIALFNVHLKSMQYWNTVFLISWFIPDEWDNIKTIDIKEK